MKRTQHSLVLLLLICMSYIACKNDSTPTTSTSSSRKTVNIPKFNADNAYDNIQKQLDFGYRVPGTEAHRACGDWLESQLKSLGAKTYRQNFTSEFFGLKDVASFNIMAQFNPEKNRRILLAAHWDSRMIAEKDDERKDEPIAGADDGGSGVGVLLEIARLISENPIDMGVDILFFDAEDQGSNDDKTALSWAQGAQYWSSNLVPSGYNAEYGILLDMVGSEGAVFNKEELSYENARDVVNKVWTLAERMGYSDFFRNVTSGRVIDDHYWVMKNAQIRMIDIINQPTADRSNFGAYHHTHDDNMDIISKRTLRVVGQVVTATIYNESIGILK